MMFRVYAIRDRAVDSYLNPMFLLSDGQAIRSFTDEVNRADKDNQLYQHPDDFDLYYLGLYDSGVAGFTCDKPPAMLLLGKQAAIRS